MFSKRITTPQELEQALQIRRRVFIEEQQVPEEIEVDAFDEDPDRCTHVLVMDGYKPVGTGRMRKYENGWAKMQRIAVLPEYRGKRVGAAIMAALEQEAREQGFVRATLEAQCHAEGFYKRLCYVTVSDVPFLDAGIEHVRMDKDPL